MIRRACALQLSTWSVVPVDSHLTWAEVRSFAPGLWTAQDQLMPSTAAQQMIDCFAVPSGGLRAWFKPTAFPTTGIVSLTLETPVALFVHEGLINRSGSGIGNDYYLITANATDTFTRVYRMDQTAAGPPVVWTLIKTHAAGLVPSFVPTCNYITAAGDRYFCYALGAANGADNGVWLVKYSDGSLNHLLSGQQPIVANYQSRLIVAGSVAGGNSSVIQFTDPGTLANILTNVAPVDISEGLADISGFSTFSPGDLIVFKRGAPIYLVEGDLDNYTVRQMNGSKFNGTNALRGPQGVIFAVSADGFYETPDGSVIQPLSKQIAASQVAGPMLWHNHYMFTGSGLVYDHDTGTWFSSSFVTSSMVGTRLDLNVSPGPGFFFADKAATFALWTMPVVDGASSARAESYTWKSAPLRDPTGRQIEVRAVEVYARSTNAATSSITVTVNGVARTIACDSSGRGALTFYFMNRREEVDITITAASNAAGVEAPRVEAIRIGSQGGHFLPGQASDVG